MEKGKPKFKIGDKVKVECCRNDDFPRKNIYGATVINVGYGIRPIYHCWQYQVKYDDNKYSFGWLLEDIIKFPNEQFDTNVEVLE